ncbi:MAG: hypothetical protein IPP90_14995 [Gemmatimonadaceae bacterium]|nr:hypothetical protein [Gemmatimonadaceae bacterium]
MKQSSLSPVFRYTNVPPPDGTAALSTSVCDWAPIALARNFTGASVPTRALTTCVPT